MIYFGVKLFHNAFKIVALSQSFALLGKRFFITDHFDKSKQWADELKLELYESAQWFFDEQHLMSVHPNEVHLYLKD